MMETESSFPEEAVYTFTYQVWHLLNNLMILTGCGPILALTSEKKHHSNWEGTKTPISNYVDILRLLRSKQNIYLPKHEGCIYIRSIADRKLHLSKHVNKEQKATAVHFKIPHLKCSRIFHYWCNEVTTTMTSLSESWGLCPSWKKKETNYHQVKITTINVFITSEGSNVCKQLKLVDLFIKS